MKKLVALVLCLMMALSAVPVFAEETAEKTLYYPSFLQESEGETLVLNKEPQRIVCLSTAALQILVRADVHPIAISSPSSAVEYPDWVYELPTIDLGMKTIDMESVLAAEPDLVIVGSYQKERVAGQLQDAGVPVYYTSEGPSITYEEAREGSICMAKSFGGDELAAEVESEFAAVENRAREFCDTYESQSMMIFFHTPGTYLQTSQGYLGSMLKMLPFENLTDKMVDPSLRTTPTDMESVLTQNPEIIFAISPMAGSGEMLQEMYEEAFAQNPEVWDQMDAIRNDNIVYLSGEYVTCKGIQVIDSLNALMDLLEGEDEEAQIVLEYPENMQALGFTEPVVLDYMPEKVVCMSSNPVMILYNLGVSMIGIPTTSVQAWPEDLAANAQQMRLAHNKDFDIETVVKMEPDLVILGRNNQDTYGKVLEGIDVPVYYVDAGHMVSYDSVKSLTVALVNAFGADTEEGKAMVDSFTNLEEKLVSVREKLAGKTVMVLQSAPPAHYIQSKGGTLGSMADMIGLTNVFESKGAPMVQIDYEKAIDYNPDLVLCVGMSPSGEEHLKMMKEDFANNPDYWNAIPAIKEGNIIGMPVSYVASAGINVVNLISDLADMVEEHFNVK